MMFAKSCNEFPFTLSIHSLIGSEKIVQILIESGANVNAVDEDNDSALMRAANKGNVSTVLKHLIL